MKNKSFCWGYISGLIDGEGNVCNHAARVTITNTDLKIISALENCLRLVDITFSTIKRKGYIQYRDTYNVYIRGIENINKLLAGCSIHSPTKISRLRDHSDYKKQIAKSFNKKLTILKSSLKNGLSLRKSLKLSGINSSTYYRKRLYLLTNQK